MMTMLVRNVSGFASNVQCLKGNRTSCHFHAFNQKVRRKKNLQIVGTSEHWWEDEEEFDSLTDALKPKRLAILVSGTSANQDSLKFISNFKHFLEPVDFNAGFCDSSSIDLATQLWSGRDKPPYFLKMRRRMTLDASDRLGDFFSEILQQNWRVDLDAGLGTEEPEAENILIVCSAQVAPSIIPLLMGRDNLGQAWDDQTHLYAYAVVEISGTTAGDPTNWRELQKTIRCIEITPPQNNATLQIL